MSGTAISCYQQKELACPSQNLQRNVNISQGWIIARFCLTIALIPIRCKTTLNGLSTPKNKVVNIEWPSPFPMQVEQRDVEADAFPDLPLVAPGALDASVVGGIADLQMWIRRRSSSVSPEDMREIWSELIQAMDDTTPQKNPVGLSRIQLEVTWVKLNCSEDFSQINPISNQRVIEIMAERGVIISCNTALRHCLVRTCQGKRWIPGYTGGCDAKLSVIETRLFRENIQNGMMDINCLTTFQGVELAHELQLRRYKKALTMLIVMGLLEYVGDLIYPQEEPTLQWLSKFCKKNQISICVPQQLELARRLNCHKDVIIEFFDGVAGLLADIDPRLLLNMDETSLSAAKKFKVLKVQMDGLHCSLPLIVQEGKLPHLTGCITVSADGKLFKPLIILPNLKHLKGLSKFTGLASFASSVTGWMNSELFLIWARDIVAQISWYRQMELDEDIRSEWIIIVLDGHISRFNLEACCLLHWARIKLLLLPPHTTHVLQAVDVGITGPTKTAFKKKLTSSFKGKDHNILDLDGHILREPLKKTCADDLRVKMVDSFIDALHTGANPGNIRAAFEKSGLYPFNLQRALTSQFVAETEALEKLLGGVRPIHPPNIHPFLETNHRTLSDDAGLVAFAEHVLHRPPTLEDLTLDVAKFQSIVERGQATNGNHNVSLTGMPRMIVNPIGQGGHLQVMFDS
jgi:hypothetical protein